MKHEQVDIEKLRAILDEPRATVVVLMSAKQIVRLGIDDVRSALGELAALRERTRWREIESAPKDGTDVLVRSEAGGQEIVRSAFWCDGAFWSDNGFDSLDEARGWWSYRSSVGSVKLEGMFAPEQWAALPLPEAQR